MMKNPLKNRYTCINIIHSFKNMKINTINFYISEICIYIIKHLIFICVNYTEIFV